MPLQSRPITAMWANMELGLAGWMASSWPIIQKELYHISAFKPPSHSSSSSNSRSQY